MYSFKAKVVRGRGLGRKLGFPTANLDKKNLAIGYGVYLAKARLGGAVLEGLLHYGPKKTFDGKVSCEVYLNNFRKNIYGRTLSVEVGGKVRGVRKFKSAAQLKKQIEIDLRSLGT